MPGMFETTRPDEPEAALGNIPSTPPAAVASASEWKANWPLVLAASVGFSFFIILTASTGLFFEPLTREFAWSRRCFPPAPPSPC